MTQNYSTESLHAKLATLNLPFAQIFARALVALLTGRKISLHQVTQLMPGEQNPEANRQQMRRCLDHETLNWQAWTLAIAALLPPTPWILALDRTEWKRGKTTINLLVLAVVVHGCAVPLLWTVMPNCGASDTTERKAIMKQFLALFGKERVQFLTADREFIGFDWIAWLIHKNIPFRIRIKANASLVREDGREKQAWEWFIGEEGQESRCLSRRMDLWGSSVYVGGKPLRGNEYLIVISNQPGDLLEDYRLRWKVETLFQALKGRGFDLESCRLSKEKRLSGWFGFLALGLCWCVKVGQCLEETDPLPLKRHGRRSVSVFQRGFRLLQSLLACLAGRPRQEQFHQALTQLGTVK